MPAKRGSRSSSRNRVRSASQKTAVEVEKNGTSKVRKSRSTSPKVVDDGVNIRVSRRIQDKIEKELAGTMSKQSGDSQQTGDAGVAKMTVETRTYQRSTVQVSSTSNEKTEPQVQPHLDVIAFGGSVGGALLTVFLPLTVYAIIITCDKSNGCTLEKIPSIPMNWKAYLDINVFGVVLAWYAFQAALAMVPLGPVVKGQPLKDGRRLNYRCNAFLATLVTVCVFFIMLYLDCDMDYIYSHWLQFVTASLVLSFLLSVALYVKALYAPERDLAPECNGSFFNDFFMGRELNPRIGSLDLKFFFELRPGLIGWMLIDWCLCASQFQSDGKVEPALALVSLFHTIYVFDAVRNEHCILTTMDITTEGFGFMLAFGDLVWVPCLYSLQAQYIYTYPQHAVSNVYALVSICALEALGLYIFRAANSQKDQFRSNPNSPAVAHLRTIPTSTGKKLLSSGFWGISRRPNYLGDLMMATAWSLTCGMTHLLPYFYPIHFFILLSHRQVRDEAYCKQKYGAAWDKYCRVVPYRIIPYIF